MFNKWIKIITFILISLVSSSSLLGEENTKQLSLQKKYFFSMPRAFGILTDIDYENKSVKVKLDKDGRIVDYQLKDSSETRFMGTFGELEDFTPGMHVMLFMLVDKDRQWLHPKAMIDQLSFLINHKRFAEVIKIDRANMLADLEWTHKTKGKQSLQIEVNDKTKFKIGQEEGNFSLLKEGMNIVFQQQMIDDKLIAIEILDQKAASQTTAKQEEVSLKRQIKSGIKVMTTYSNPPFGSLHTTLLRRADSEVIGKSLQVNQKLTIEHLDGRVTTAIVHSIKKERRKLDLVLSLEPGFAALFVPGDFCILKVLPN